MLAIWLAPLGSVAALIGFYRWASRPGVNRLHSPAQMPRILAALLNQGIENARVEVIDRDVPQRRFVFRKHVRAQNDVGIHGSFVAPDDDPESSKRLGVELQARGIAYSVVRSPHGRDEVQLDFAHDRGLAHLVLRLVFERVFNVRVEGSCDAYMYDVLFEPAPNLTRVDRPVI